MNAAQAAQQITRDGFHWGTAIGSPVTVSFGFHTSAAGFSVFGHDTSEFSQLGPAQQAAARAALGLWSSVANITFTDLGDSNGAAIEFANYHDQFDGSQAFAYYPGGTSAANPAGDVFINTAFASTTNVAPGSYDFLTFVHEIGHAVGLGHPGDYNAAPGVKITYEGSAEYVEDTHQYSLMSYFGENFTGANFFGTNPETPMMHDIAAIQRLYGANTATRAGGTTYGFNSNAGSPYDITSGSQAVVFAVWDAGGTDTFDFSGYSQRQTINLNAESFSSVGGLIGNVSIARGVTIEIAIGGSGSDRFTGNGAANTMRGGLENDTIDGGSGVDTAVFSGLRSAYTLTALSGNAVRVSGPDGTDTLSNVERLAFSDQTLIWPLSGVSDDYADSFTDSTALFGQIVVNGSGTGKLEVAGDRDWFSVELTSGTSYSIELQGLHAGGGLTLEDPFLRLHNGSGGLLAQNNDLDPGVNRDSRLTYTATATGTHYLDAGAFNGGHAGTYSVSVVAGAASSDDFADGFADTTAPFGQVAVNGSATGRLETTGDRDWFRVQLAAGASYVIDLQGLQAGAGTLEDPYLRVHGSGGALLAEDDDLVLGVNRDSQLTYRATTAGAYYIEAGAFGDGYSGTYRVRVAGLTPPDDFADSLADATAPFGQLALNASGTGNLEATGDRDWFRIQLAAGTSYVFNLQGTQAGGGTLEDPYLRVRDSSGALLADNDDIVSGINRDAQLTFTSTAAGSYYLEAGAFDDDYSGSYTVSATGSAANSIVGDNSANTLTGTAESDTIQGLGDADFLDGGAGDDILLGGAGSDFLIGGPGDDSIDGGAIADRINGSDGNLVSYSSSTGAINLDLASGITQDGLGGTDTLANINVVRGSDSSDTITGSSAREFEFFEGGPGNDTIDGGVIADTRLFTDSNRALYDGAGSAVSVDLRAGTASGGAGSDILINMNQVQGSNFNDSLRGSDAALIIETFEGGAGNDILDGRGGFDIVRYNSAASGINVNLITGAATDGLGGSDTLLNIEGMRGSTFNDILTGGNAANGTGATDGLETFQGNAGNDIINGGGGYDRVDFNFTGGGAVIVKLGGTGNGIAQDGLGGTDTLINIEGVRGSSSNDSLTGSNSGVFESFEGGEGNDAMDGRGGIDRADYFYDPAGVTVNLAAGTAKDGYGGTDALSNIETVRGSRNFDDSITGNSGSNLLEGRGGNDTLNGGSGADTMAGGAGNDSFVVNSALDVVTEAPGAGTDLVQSTAALYTLSANVENLTLTGAAAINGTGNTLDNVLTGNKGNNVLTGGSGNDTLNGALGNDTLNGGSGSDAFLFASALGAANIDRVTGYSVADDTIRLENAIFTSLTGTGTLSAGSFRSGAGLTTAADANDFIIYNTSNGQLFYDAGGNTGAASQHFATLVGAPGGLTAADFLIV